MVFAVVEIPIWRCYLFHMPSAGARTALLKEDNELSHHTDAAPLDAATPGLPMTQVPTELTSEALLDRILASLDSDKAEDIVTIDLQGKSSVADYMVVCSGRSTRQVTAIAEKLTAKLKQQFDRASKIEGKDMGDWVLIDTGDIVVHVFRPEVREFYQLEKMWLPAGEAASKA